MDGHRKIDVYTHVGPNEKKSALVSIEFEKRGPILEITPCTFKEKTHDIETLYMCPLPMNVKLEQEEMLPENEDDGDGSDDQSENDGQNQLDQDENGGKDEDDQDENISDESETRIAVSDDVDGRNPELTAYFDYFKGLYPDYAKLDPGRKEVFRCTLNRLMTEQSLA